MCCLFTCLGWVIDLIQRVWTFTMSCCISSAVCCTLVIASMAGVALGYNYSLAEYTETRETNVSVYLKRGVFDDSLVDEMDWRRKGGGPPPEAESPPEQSEAVESSARRYNAELEPQTPSVRRLDDSIIESNDARRFEGSLLKLTATPLYLPRQTLDKMSSLAGLDEVAKELDSHQRPGPNPYEIDDSLERYKNLEGSRRKALHILNAATESSTKVTRPLPWATDTRKYPDAGPESGRRMVPPIEPDLTTVYSMRFAVPAPNIRTWHDANQKPPDPWESPILKNARKNLTSLKNMYRELLPPPPKPPNIVGSLRRQPTEPSRRLIRPIIVDVTTEKTTLITEEPKTLKTEKTFEEDSRESDVIKTLNEPELKDYDDEDIKGLPVRRRRSIAKANAEPDNHVANSDPVKNLKGNSKNYDNGLYKNLVSVLKNFNIRSLIGFEENT